jgi:di/tricarboxylate transporter
MGIDGWMTLGVIGLLIGLLIFTRYAADVILLGGLTLLMVMPVPGEDGWRIGVLGVAQGLSGLANPGMVTVGVLFIVAAAVKETGALAWVGQHWLGKPRSLTMAHARIMLPVAATSAFLNNTPVVAMFIPILLDWAKKHQLSPSKLLLPLSYAAILGGTCTLIGTSTNLVVNGLLISDARSEGLGMFEIAWVGLPCAVAGVTYILIFGRLVLRERRPAISIADDARQYSVEMTVEPGSPLVGRSIEDAGLRNLPGMYLIEIDRGGQLLAAVPPDTRLQANDRLVFVGVVESVVDLQKIRGLKPVTDQVFKLNAPRRSRCLIEAVVSNTCPLLGRSIREGRFRTVYNAAVIAVARSGQRIRKKIGDIILQPGDTLLLEATPDFVERQRNRRDFFLVSAVEGSTPPRHERAPVALALIAGMVIVVTFGWLQMLQAAMLAAGLMIITRCITATEARRSVDWSVLMVIASSFGIGRALDVTGAAEGIASSLIRIAGENPYLTLIVIYGLTTLFTELITNNAAAVLMFPIAMATAHDLNVDYMPFIITIMIGASASFASPLGYQTNLMVYGPGGYRFTDYLRAGLPLNLMMWTLTATLAPWFWPFNP